MDTLYVNGKWSHLWKGQWKRNTISGERGALLLYVRGKDPHYISRKGCNCMSWRKGPHCISEEKVHIVSLRKRATLYVWGKESLCINEEKGNDEKGYIVCLKCKTLLQNLVILKHATHSFLQTFEHKIDIDYLLKYQTFQWNNCYNIDKGIILLEHDTCYWCTMPYAWLLKTELYFPWHILWHYWNPTCDIIDGHASMYILVAM